MQQTFLSINDLLTSGLAELKLVNFEDLETQEAFLEDLAEQLYTLNHELTMETLGFEKSIRIQAVLTVQTQICQCANLLTTYVTDPENFDPYVIPPHPNFNNLVSLCYILLEDFLQMLELNYPDAFDIDQQPPQLYTDYWVRSLQFNADRFLLRLNAKTNNKSLLEEVFAPFEELHRRQGILSISFKLISYLKYYADELLSISNGELQGEALDSKLMHLLWRFNVNSERYLEWYIRHLEVRLELMETPGERETEIRSIRKQMLLEEQISHRLFQSRSSLRDAVTSWLDEELHILRLQQSTGGTETGKSPGKERHPETLKLGCSVSVFSALIRLLADHEVIQESNTQRIVRFIASNFCTRKNERISEHTIHNLVYRTTSTTQNEVIRLLNTMGKSINNR